MGQIITLSISYNKGNYYVLVQPTQIGRDKFMFHASLIATEGHSKIYERFVFEGNDKELRSVTPGDESTTSLMEAISSSLKAYLNTTPMWNHS